MAQIPNTKALTEGDGLNDYLNVNTVNKRLELPNGMTLVQYADNYTTTGLQLAGGNLAPLQSATAVATGAAGTIATANIGISRISPAAARTGVILAAGTIPGQQVLVVNEAVAGNSATFDVSGTSNVADGVQDVIPGLSARLYVWDSVTALWYPVGSLTIGDALGSVQSATAVATLANGTVATAGLSVSRVSPAAARTGIIIQAGTFPGQQVTIVNEATAANSLTLNTTPATANVADSATEAAIAGLTARSYVWDSATALWYRCN